MRGHHWWGAAQALLAAAFVAAATGLIGISAYFDVTPDVFARLWLPRLVPAAVLALALLGLAGGLVIQQANGVGAERGWLVVAHIIAPLALFTVVPLLCLGRIVFQAYTGFTPGLTIVATMLTAIAVTAVGMLGAQQLRRHPRGRRRHLFWLMSMDTICVVAFAALVFAYMFVELPP